MKLYLDDLRDTPTGWHRVFWPDEAIRLLKTGCVKLVSLDHDLGDDTRGTGNTVFNWIEEEVFEHGFRPPEIIIHTSNPAARLRMEAAAESIRKLAKRRSQSRKRGI